MSTWGWIITISIMVVSALTVVIGIGLIALSVGLAIIRMYERGGAKK